jgi:hypothetical protein
MPEHRHGRKYAMNNRILRGTRLAAAAALIGGAALGTAHATDWNQLKANSWGGAEAGASAEAESGADKVASAEADTSGNYGAQIATAFQNLGMEPARAGCYGETLTQQLSPEEQEQAAQLVASASTGEEVRIAVMDAGPTMVGGFSAADASCPEGMGG